MKKWPMFFLFIPLFCFGYSEETERILYMFPEIKEEEIKQSLEELLGLLKRKSIISEDEKYRSEGIINYTIPEILYCNYHMSVGKKYYYPLVKEKRVAESLKKFFHIKISQKIGAARRNLGLGESLDDREDLAKNLILFIKTLLVVNGEKGLFPDWDTLIYNINCMAGAMVFNTKEYSAKVNVNLKMSKNGVLNAITYPKFSCITLTNLVLFITEIVMNEALVYTDNSGNSEHSYVKSRSDLLGGKKIYLDPFTFYYEFKEARLKFKRVGVNYLSFLKNIYPIGIAYEATARNFRGIFFDNETLPPNCFADFSLVPKDSSGRMEIKIRDLSPQCEGGMFSMTWTNPKTKKRQAKTFAVLKDQGNLVLRNLPSPKVYTTGLRNFVGDLSDDFIKFFNIYFGNSVNLGRGNIQFKKIRTFEEFLENEIGDFSEFYKN